MNPRLLALLRCPFCGGPFQWAPAPDDIGSGKLLCDCCAYPVLEGIPFLRTGALAQEALRELDQGDAPTALPALLEIPEGNRSAFIALRRSTQPVTFRDALALLPGGAESPYLLHRFSDPTFLAGEAALRAFARDQRGFQRPALDVGGGAGHLTRTLLRLAGGQDVVLADASFWKLWLAKRFVVPTAEPVCCDANVPLPFAACAFSFVFCSDAFHYIWSKRLLADEMMRAAGEDGRILLAHLHNALAANESAGMPLAPAGWRRLFEARQPRLFRESAVLDSVLRGKPLDFTHDLPDGDLPDESALLLAAGGTVPGRVNLEPLDPRGCWAINPLYRVEPSRDGVKLKLEYPNAAYAVEFAGGRRYLPEQAELSASTLAAMRAGSLTGALRELVERRVVLDLPANYLP